MSQLWQYVGSRHKLSLDIPACSTPNGSAPSHCEAENSSGIDGGDAVAPTGL
ncbi:uncharacterized protein PHALS_06628 [Plasmopara halstedii]|uniref:Uncharacterized protein n=1 Tax=Plasmopara halstedii TaxID=4781 RepID=A0A0P1B3M0_PLAHL|nr:uncharacterized protein PHALS_06628 [Plasmopara halstedii]CEG48828.1 hypothetical protein PHALS_06628 [Plasmopara halstedii]|eukprot:XP_024585197.1 hypothetical protein PHALS_06628 [Plasmopara halstedii]